MGHGERSRAAELLATVYYHAYRGTPSWETFRMAIDEALEDPEPDPVRIARLCGSGTAIPTRWPGSMTTTPSEADVSRYVDIGLDHAPPGDSRERVRLLAVRASWPFAFPQLTLDEEDVARYTHDGLEAAEAALRLGLPDLASEAFDAAGGAFLATGRYADLERIESRRIAIVDELGDPLEVGDAFAMMSWSTSHQGRYREALGFAEQGLSRVSGMVENSAVHLLAWVVRARYHLGQWDESLASFRELQERLDDRREEPPNFVAVALVAAANIHEHRGAKAEARHLKEILLRAVDEPVGGRSPIQPWAASLPLLVAQGDLDEARVRLDDRAPGWATCPADVFEAAGNWVAAAADWGRAAGYVEEMQAFDADTGCRPIGWMADRLEGRWRSATGDPKAAVEAFGRARAGLARAEAVHEVAVCDLEIAEARGRDRLTEAERGRLEEAIELFERLRSVRELDRVRAL